MNLSTLKIGLVLTAAASVLIAERTDAKAYFVGPEANAAAGTVVTYRNMEFTVGINAFSGIWSALGVLEENSQIYFSPNSAIGSFPVRVKNVELIGANAWCDAWSGKRTSAETNITGTITVEASGCTINGFCFTKAGCVRNETAGRGSTCLEGFRYIYNKCAGTTLTAGTNTALLCLGEAWRPVNTDAAKQDPSKWAAIERYHNVEVAHNLFEGAEAENQPDFVQIAGSGIRTTVTNNRFVAGGTSVSLYNTQGDIDVSHNTFTNVGKGAANGQFCLRLFYIGASAVADQYATANVKNNIFDGCTGQNSMWSLIRFFSGDSNEKVYQPNNCRVNVNHNTFRNKTTTGGGGYNYVFYGNNTHTTTADVDCRWNHYDNSEMCFGWVKPAWETKGQRYFAASTGKFNYESKYGTTVDFYGKKDANGNVLFGRETPTGGAGGLKNWTVGTQSVTGIPMHTVVQSMDIDDWTGDVYLVNQCNKTNTSGKKVVAAFPGITWSDAFLFMSRVISSTKETHMYLSFGGHGSNMAVARYNGKVYILTGGVGTQSSTDPTKICIFPWADGKALDLRKDASVRYLTTNHGHNMPYPSVDNDNRLLVVRSRESNGDYFTVYDLDDAMANPGSAKIIKQVFVQKGARKITGSSRAFLNTADSGFKTWSDQGFTISGDYIYTYEGDGKDGYGSNPKPTDGKAVLIVNIINWRTGEYIQRSAILKSTIVNDMCQGVDSGEPESLKIHRDAYGRPYMVIGVITGEGGSYKTPRKYNCFAYKLKAENGQGDVMSINPHAYSASHSSLSFNSYGETQSANVSASTNGILDGVHASIVGADGESFSVRTTSANAYTVSFNPNKRKNNYQAWLRLSAPNTSDTMVPLYGTYNGVLDTDTGVDDITADSSVTGEATYFDLSGRRLTEPQKGINIIRYPDGKAEKVMIR